MCIFFPKKSIKTTLTSLALLVSVFSAHADVFDCTEYKMAHIWMGEISNSLKSVNSTVPKFIDEVIAARKKNDAGKSFEKIADKFSCSAFSMDPSRENPEGLMVILFTHKNAKIPLNQRQNQPSIQLWAYGGSKAYMEKSSICYTVKYKLDPNVELTDSFVKADKSAPFPETVSSCY